MSTKSITKVKYQRYTTKVSKKATANAAVTVYKINVPNTIANVYTHIITFYFI